MQPVIGSLALQGGEGTGNGSTFAMDPPVVGAKAFSDVVGAADFYYQITNPAYGQWEQGVGTVSGNTLSRTTVIANSEGTTSRLDLKPGYKFIQSVLPEKILNEGVRGTEYVVSGTTLGQKVGHIPVYKAGSLVGYVVVNADTPP